LALALVALGGPVMVDPAWAEPSVSVLLLRPIPTSPLLSEAILRIRSELSAGGFEVVVRDSPASALQPEPHALMERAAELPAPSVTLAIFGDLDKGTASLWVVDRITGKAVVRHVEVETSDDRPISEVLAIRAQELLRARLVEVVVEDERREPPAVVSPPQVERAQHPSKLPFARWRLGLELGLSALAGWGDIGPALAPTARLRVALGDRFWLRLTAMGLGTEPRVRAPIGSARVSQDLLLLECAVWLRPGRRLRPVVSVGLGSERFVVDGTTSSSSYQGAHSARWFFAADLGAGLAVRLGAHWEAQLELHALVAVPRPVVRFFDVAASHAGEPTLLGVLTLAGGV
jgi:hypothetical protein